MRHVFFIISFPFFLFTNALSSVHFTESFTGAFSTSVYSDGTVSLGSGSWDYNQIRGESALNSYGGSGNAARFKNNLSGGSYLITPPVNSLGKLSFYYRELNSGGGTFKIQKSVNGAAFADIGSQSYSGTSYTLFTLNVDDSSYNIKIKILSDNNPGLLIVDEVTLTSTGDTLTGQPIITSVTLSDGNFIIGDSVSVTILADAPGYMMESLSVNNSAVSNFIDNGNNTYSAKYFVKEGDPDATQTSAIPINVVLSNGGILNLPYTTPPLGNLTIDANRPVLNTAQRISDTEIKITINENLNPATIVHSNDGGFIVNDLTNVLISYPVSSVKQGASNSELLLSVSDFGTSGNIGVSVKYVSGGNGNYTDIAGNLMNSSITPLKINAWDISGASDLFISEYVEGSSNNKAIELYNGTGVNVDLSSYKLQKDLNGDGNFTYSYTYSGILNNGEVFILSRTDADTAILAVADALNGSVINFNGNDQVRLVKNDIEIDRIGISGGLDFAKDITFVRKPSVCTPKTGEQNPNTNGEWDIYPMNTFNYLGFHSANCLTKLDNIEFERNITVEMYPNPFKERFYIDVSNIKSVEYIINVSNVLGNILYNKKVSGDTNPKNIEICAKNFAPGIYFIKFTSSDQVFFLKVIKS